MEAMHKFSNSLGSGLLLFDENLRVYHVNDRAGAILGAPPGTFLHEPLETIDALFKDDSGQAPPHEIGPLTTCISRKKRLIDFRASLMRPNGIVPLTVPISLNASPLWGEEGRIEGLIVDFMERRGRDEERLCKFVGCLDEIVFEFDGDGRFLNAWTEDKDLLTCSPADLFGHNLNKVLPKDLAQEILSLCQRIRKTGCPETFEFCLDGMEENRWFSARLTLVPSPVKEPTYYFLARDITRQKHIENSLSKSEKRFRGLFENAAIGIALIDTDGRFLDANPYFNDLFGYSQQEFQQNSIWDYSHPEDRHIGLEQFKQLVRGEIETYCQENRYLHRDGRLIWGHLTVTLQKDERQEPLYCIAILEDITGRKRAEAQKEMALKELEAIFASAADGIIFYDLKGDILRMNTAAELITGYTDKEKKQGFFKRYQGWTRYQDKTKGGPFADLGISAVFKGETVKKSGVQFTRPDGETAWISFSASPIVGAHDGQVIGVVTTFTDMSEIRRLQERQENYIHMLAHDLRTPLTVIAGHAELLRAAIQSVALGSKSLLNIESILNATDQMDKMMEDLIEVGRIESGQITLYQDLVLLADFMNKFLDQQIGETYQRVRVKVPSDLPLIRFGIRHLERCVGNVIGNALKYSDSNHPVDVEAFFENGQVCLVVRDYGKGIDSAEIPYIFNRFYRTNGAKKHASGTGMGLYISKSLIESYGGTISVESEPQKGSRFLICFPEVSEGSLFSGRMNLSPS